MPLIIKILHHHQSFEHTQRRFSVDIVGFVMPLVRQGHAAFPCSGHTDTRDSLFRRRNSAPGYQTIWLQIPNNWICESINIAVVKKEIDRAIVDE